MWLSYRPPGVLGRRFRADEAQTLQAVARRIDAAGRAGHGGSPDS